jgi:hypothetical protein
MGDVSAASCYYQAAVFHHPSGGHKTRLGLICPFEKNMDTPLSERFVGDIFMTTPITSLTGFSCEAF